MAGASMSSLILFIAAMLVAAGVAGTLVTNVNQVSNSIDRHSGDVREGIDTDLEVISDPGSDAVYDDSGGNVTLLLKNTGAETLPTDPGALDVVVGGEYVTGDEMALSVYEATTWRPGAVAELEIDRALGDGEHRVAVSANGNREVFEFYVAENGGD